MATRPGKSDQGCGTPTPTRGGSLPSRLIRGHLPAQPQRGSVIGPNASTDAYGSPDLQRVKVSASIRARCAEASWRYLD